MSKKQNNSLLDNIILFIIHFFSKLELDTASRLGCLLGHLFFLSGIRKKVVYSNIKKVFGTKKHMKKIAIGGYQTIVINYLETCCLKKEDSEKRQQMFSQKAIDNIKKNNPKCIILSLHSGSWDIAGVASTSIFNKVYAYSKGFSTKKLTDFIDNKWNELGLNIFYTKGSVNPTSPLKTIRVMRENDSIGIGMFSDQNKPKGKTAYFLGNKKKCSHGHIAMAIRNNLSIIPLFNVRIGHGKYYFFAGKPWNPSKTTYEEALQYSMDQLSVIIAKYPKQHFWLHKHFKRKGTTDKLYKSQWKQGLRLLIEKPKYTTKTPPQHKKT